MLCCFMVPPVIQQPAGEGDFVVAATHMLAAPGQCFLVYRQGSHSQLMVELSACN